ncbi:NADPH-dependent FMN reductase [Streptomyces sp. NPDC004838]
MDLATRENPHSTTAIPAPLKLVVISASNREGRFGPVVADWTLGQTAQRDDFDVAFVDLGTVDLPTALVSKPASTVRDSLSEVSPLLAGADAFVVVTPEYNHSFPASIKSLIDWHFGEWRAKPVGFVSYGGMSGGLRAVEHLRQVFAELHAVTVRDTVSFHQAQKHFDHEGRHRNPTACGAAATSMLDQLSWWGQALRDAKSVRPYAG